MALGDFSDIILRLRQEAGITQEQLAKELGVSRSAIIGYENSTKYPDFEVLKRIAEYFKVSADYLLGRTTTKVFYGDILQAVEENLFLDELLRSHIKYNYTTLFHQLCGLTKPQINKVREMIRLIFASDDEMKDFE